MDGELKKCPLTMVGEVLWCGSVFVKMLESL